MKRTPLSEESRILLIENTGKTIEYVSKEVTNSRKFLKQIDSAKKLSETIKINDVHSEIFDPIEKMLEFKILIGIIFLDLASATRAHLKSDLLYEKRFSIRQIIVIINEGYKQIYNFVNTNASGEKITKHREKSYWYEDIRGIINNNLPELKTEYDDLTKQLDDYYNENFEKIKEQRSLSVHYDRKASNVYDMSVKLDADKIFKKMSPFLGILTEMFRFIDKMALISGKKEKLKRIEEQIRVESQFNKLIEKFNKAKNTENEESINKIIETMNKSKKLFLRKESPNT